MDYQKMVKQDSGALKIAGIYLLIGGLWILFSDRAVEAIASDRDVLTTLSTLKGWGYVLISALLLYWLIQRDITERKRVEDVLEESKVRLASIINSAMDSVISIDNSNQIVLFNPAAEKMFGYTAEEIMGQPLDILIPELYRAKHRKQVEHYGQTGITNRHMNGYLEITGVRKNGDEFPIDTSISQIDVNGGKLFTAILRDVTEHKQTEQTLRKMHDDLELQFQLRTDALSQANSLLETMLEYVPDQIYFKDAESRFIKNSRSQARALGLSDPSLAVGRTDFDFFPHAQRSFDEEQEIMRSGKPQVDFEERVVWPDGKETWVSTSKVPLRNLEGSIVGTFGISRDITDRKRAEESLRKAKDELEVKVAERTAQLREANERLQLELTERKQAEEALRNSEIRYRRLFEAAKDGILILDADTGRIVDVNPFLTRLLGYSHEAFLGGTIWDLGLFKDIVASKENFLELQQKEYIRYDDLPLETANGQQINVEFVSNVYQVNQQRVIQCNIRDITERKKTEDRQHFLADASRALAASLDYQTTLTTVAQLAVPKIADWCTVYLVAADGSIEQVALTHARPEKIKWARELQQRYPPNPNVPGGVAQVIRSGQAEFLPEIPAELLEPLKKDPEISKLLDELQLTGLMTVPLTIQERTLGAISLVSAESRIHFTSSDLELAEELARRVALVLENVRLYRAAQQLNETLEQRIVERTLALRESEERYRTLFDSIDEGFCIIEMIFDELEKPVDYRFLSVNPTFEKQTGLADAQGKTMRWFAPNHEEYWFEIYGRIALTGEPARFENRAEQLHRWYDVHAVRFGIPEKRQVAILFNDITVRKASEAEVQRLNEDLQQHSTQLEAINKELEAFAYSVSHDLRSPLRGIDGWSMALLEDYGPILDEQGQGHIQKVRAEAQRMGTIIDDILRLSRITRADMTKEKVDLSAIAETVAARLQEVKPEDRQVEFTIQKGLITTGDLQLLDVVLTNLLGNAFKFTSKKQEARIEFGQTLVEGELAYFVRDNGAGFDMAYANKLFGAFQRMHRTSEFPGTGIGLATVQRIINRHGGSIWASSEVEQGATFYFTLENHKK